MKKAWKKQRPKPVIRMNVKRRNVSIVRKAVKKMVQIRKVLGSLGLAMKAGDVVSGEFMTEKAIREGLQDSL